MDSGWPAAGSSNAFAHFTCSDPDTPSSVVSVAVWSCIPGSPVLIPALSAPPASAPPAAAAAATPAAD